MKLNKRRLNSVENNEVWALGRTNGRPHRSRLKNMEVTLGHTSRHKGDGGGGDDGRDAINLCKLRLYE